MVALTGPSPSWARSIAIHRGFFQGAVLRLTGPAGGEQIVKVLFCLQNPFVVGFVGLTAEEEVIRHPDEDRRLDSQTWAHNFKVVPWSFSFPDGEEYAAECEVEELSQAVWRGDHTVVSDSDWRLLPTILQTLPQRRVGCQIFTTTSAAPVETRAFASLVSRGAMLRASLAAVTDHRARCPARRIAQVLRQPAVHAQVVHPTVHAGHETHFQLQVIGEASSSTAASGLEAEA
mmetsp:Transcript_32998/g.84255  ORF Transcript_32998/g.84255 Transcript_32998/m.84255 type:complete len:232 (-) Transcript_32998:352-1047(-)